MSYDDGLDVLGATALASGTQARVTSKNAAVYAANVMAPDAGAKTIGDSDPDFVLQPGAQVTTSGASVKNAHGVEYTPVTVPGRDGPFFIRASSIAPAGGVTVTTETHVEKAATPWWQWALLGVGALGVVVGAYKVTRKR
jgi:hypothetical protein